MNTVINQVSLCQSLLLVAEQPLFHFAFSTTQYSGRHH